MKKLSDVAYHIVPNTHAVRERKGLGARVFISEKWVECGYLLYWLLNRVDN